MSLQLQGLLRSSASCCAATLVVLASAVAHSKEPQAPQAAYSLTLKEAIARAVRQNPTLAAAVADVKTAEAKVLQAIGAEDFTLGAAASWSAVRGQDLQQAPDLTLDGKSLGLSLVRPLPTGGSLSLRLATEFARSVPSDGVGAPSDSYRPSALLALAQPMLRGFGADVARAGRRRAASALDQAKAQGESAAAELLRATSQSYWELAFAARQLWVHQSSLDLAREQLRAVKANIDVGKQPPSAAAEVEVAIALREDDVLQAEQFALERSLELRQTLGLATGEESAALVAADPLEPRFEARDLRTAIEAARLRNPLLAAARAQIATASTEVGVARSGLLPQLDLSLSAGPLASDATVPAAFAHLVRGGGFQVQAGLTLGLSIENTAAAGQHAAAREQLHKARRVEEAIGLQIDASVARAMSALSTTERRIAVLARATDHAALDLEAERARFQAGRSSNFDVLRRQDELARAQLQQARAKADYLQLEALIDALTAAILPRFGVALR